MTPTEQADKVLELSLKINQREAFYAGLDTKGRNEILFLAPALARAVKDLTELYADMLGMRFSENCQACKDVLGSKVVRKGLKNYLLSDLARMALGEELNY